LRIHNVAIAQVFSDMADLLEIKGDNPFRVRAYRTAARTVNGLSQDISELLANGEDLSRFPGIGKDLAKKIEEVAVSGHLEVLERLKKEVSPELIQLMKIAGLGGKRVSVLNKKLGVLTISDLERAAREHKICKIPGMGEKIERSILEGIAHEKEAGGRVMLFEAEEIAKRMTAHLGTLKEIEKMIVAGSFRRRKETVRDIDILVTGTDNPKIVEHFFSFPEVVKIISKGETRSTAALTSGIQLDIRIVPDESYGAALHYFTGSQAHNIGIRKRGVRLGLKINEYGIYRGDERIGGRDEMDVFKAVGLTFIEPELREDSGEIEAAEAGELPELVNLRDIKGDLHSHTIRTDGHSTLEEMVEAAIKRGYSYLAITDHSQRLAMAHGLTPADVAEQIDIIDKMNGSLKNFTILKGIEVDILEDGSLDLPNTILRELDVCVCSIHSKFNLSSEMQTERVIRAMDNPHFNILAHPTGRLINNRAPYEIDMERVMEAAKERGCFLEVNAYPDRLDLTDFHCRMAKSMGVRISIDTDAHSVSDLDFMRFGVGQARRGWIEKTDVINTRNLKEILKLMKRR
jgi:DNA polymerase (family 10)